MPRAFRLACHALIARHSPPRLICRPKPCFQNRRRIGVRQTLRFIVVDKRSEYSERSGGRGVCFGGGNRGGFGANQIVYGAECGGGSALHRSLNDASESRKCFCAAVVFR